MFRTCSTCIVFLSLSLVSCTAPARWFGGAAAVLGLAGAPGHEIEQTYYLGVYDPLDRLPPSFYRVRVRGQGSALGNTRFGSGWVRAELVDSLGTRIEADAKGGPITSSTSNLGESVVSPEHTMTLYGPEGVRTVPKDHRLVIVMGSSPDDFFAAVDRVLGDVSATKVELADAAGRKELERFAAEVRSELERTRDLLEDLDAEVAR